MLLCERRDTVHLATELLLCVNGRIEPMDRELYEVVCDLVVCVPLLPALLTYANPGVNGVTLRGHSELLNSPCGED